jgi:hypothetical protein
LPKVQAAPRAHSAADHVPGRPAPDRPRARTAEARRRERHFRRRRRDLLADAALGLLLAIVLLSATAGLGVLLLLVMPLAAGLVALSIVERRLARRRGGRGSGRMSVRRERSRAS